MNFLCSMDFNDDFLWLFSHESLTKSATTCASPHLRHLAQPQGAEGPRCAEALRQRSCEVHHEVDGLGLMDWDLTDLI